MHLCCLVMGYSVFTMNPAAENTVIIQDQLSGRSRWLCFQSPVEIVTTNHLKELHSGLEHIEKSVANGLYAAGFLSYESAPAMDCALKTSSTARLPYLWFGLYRGYEKVSLPEVDDDCFAITQWQPSVSLLEYERAIDRIKTHIRNGETYQVNYTFRLRTEFCGDPWNFFLKLYRAQQSSYSAFINLNGYTICSVSPELFFSLNGTVLTSRPMKGTVSRGLTHQEDIQQVKWLQASEKNRAENVMIVDMIRNDMSRIAAVGTVRVENLFAIEKYPTVHQMTSSVVSTTEAPVTEILRVMFPCASITGAPKVATMKIIADLEKESRDIYTGCIGYVAPDRAQFNVAIRTVLIDSAAGIAEYGVGSGIVWNSDTQEEYEECLMKARVLTQPLPEFDLLESLLWTPQSGYFLLDEHLTRLEESASYFDFRVSLLEVRKALDASSAAFGSLKQKVRLTVSREGKLTLKAQALEQFALSAVKVGIATKPMDRQTPFIYHKTTYRSHYAIALASQPGCSDVFLWNEDGVVTESTIANVVLDTPTGLITPPVKCGLLAGTFRARLLAQGKIAEEMITLNDLRSHTVFLINSVRGWMRLRKEATGDVWVACEKQ